MPGRSIATTCIHEASVHVLERSPRHSTSIDYSFRSNDGIERKGAMRRDLRIHRLHLAGWGGLSVVYDPVWPALNAGWNWTTLRSATIFLGVIWFELGAGVVCTQCIPMQNARGPEAWQGNFAAVHQSVVGTSRPVRQRRRTVGHSG
jgi:hypothetical protein